MVTEPPGDRESLLVPVSARPPATLVATLRLPAQGLVASRLALSDVTGTGWFGAVSANVLQGRCPVKNSGYYAEK